MTQSKDDSRDDMEKIEQGDVQQIHQPTEEEESVLLLAFSVLSTSLPKETMLFMVSSNNDFIMSASTLILSPQSAILLASGED